MGSSGDVDMVTVKVTHAGQTKRSTFKRSDLTFESLSEWITANFALPASVLNGPQAEAPCGAPVWAGAGPCSAARLVYRDPEGDAVSISSTDELNEALNLKQEDSPLSLQLTFPRMRERWQRMAMAMHGTSDIGVWNDSSTAPTATPAVNAVDDAAQASASSNGEPSAEKQAPPAANEAATGAPSDEFANISEDQLERRRAKLAARLAQLDARRNGHGNFHGEGHGFHGEGHGFHGHGPHGHGPHGRCAPHGGSPGAPHHGPHGGAGGPHQGPHHGPHGGAGGPHHGPHGFGPHGPCGQWRHHAAGGAHHAPEWAGAHPWGPHWAHPWAFQAPPMVPPFVVAQQQASVPPQPADAEHRGGFWGMRRKECEETRVLRLYNIAIVLAVLAVLFSFATFGRVLVPFFAAAGACVTFSLRRRHCKAMKWRKRQQAANAAPQSPHSVAPPAAPVPASTSAPVAPAAASVTVVSPPAEWTHPRRCRREFAHRGQHQHQGAPAADSSAPGPAAASGLQAHY